MHGVVWCELAGGGGACTAVHCTAVQLYSHTLPGMQDKSERMRAIIEYYIKGDEHALERFPGGSEPGTRR